MSKHVLIVEDNDQEAAIAFEALTEAMPGNTIHMTKHGGEGLDFLNNRPPFEDSPRPDLVLLDIKMPWCDGHEFLKIVKKDESLRAIPVVVMTTSGSEDDIRKAYQYGANCYIKKPINTAKFKGTVQILNNFWFGVAAIPKN